MLTNIKIYSKINNEVCNIAEWSSLVARRAHNPKVGGSNPPSATKLVATWDFKWLFSF